MTAARERLDAAMARVHELAHEARVQAALTAAHAADRALRRLRESNAAAWRLERAEADCNRAWAVVGEMDRPVARKVA